MRSWIVLLYRMAIALFLFSFVSWLLGSEFEEFVESAWWTLWGLATMAVYERLDVGAWMER